MVVAPLAFLRSFDCALVLGLPSAGGTVESFLRQICLRSDAAAGFGNCRAGSSIERSSPLFFMLFLIIRIGWELSLCLGVPACSLYR